LRTVARGLPRGDCRRCRRLTASALLAAAVLTAHQPASAAESASAAEAEIRAALERWQTAFNGRDEQQVCDLFAPDLSANYEGRPQHDYASLCQLLQTTLQDRDRTYRYSLKINQILVYDETAVVRLVWTLEIGNTSGGKDVIDEPAVDIFRRQADGNWKISRYLAYSSTP
jgi:ketosteroid isomerase-like protein